MNSKANTSKPHCSVGGASNLLSWSWAWGKNIQGTTGYKPGVHHKGDVIQSQGTCRSTLHGNRAEATFEISWSSKTWILEFQEVELKYIKPTFLAPRGSLRVRRYSIPNLGVRSRREPLIIKADSKTLSPSSLDMLYLNTNKSPSCFYILHP